MVFAFPIAGTNIETRSTVSNKLSFGVLRLVAGAWILNSGIGKLHLTPEVAAQLQEHAATGVPTVKQLDTVTFGKLLSAAEILLGAGLLTPFINRRLIGLALSGFAGGMLTMYFKNPAMTESDGVRPSQAGIPLSKDMWLAAIGLALLLGSSKRSK